MNTIAVIIVLAAGAFYFLSKRGGGNFDNIDAEGAKQLAKSADDIVFLDVRTPKETALGKIEDAIEADVMSSSFRQKIKDLDKDKTYVVYCRSGKRSRLASKIMSNNGFKKVYNLENGYLGWE